MFQEFHERLPTWPVEMSILSRNPDSFPPSRSGSFKLLEIPSELRNEVYKHYLYRLKALVWRRTPNYGYSRTMRCDRTGELMITRSRYDSNGEAKILALLLTSRQIYKEAIYVLSTNTTFLIERRKYKPLGYLLRVFPPKVAEALQHVEVNYSITQTARYDVAHAGHHEASPTRTWQRIIEDSYIILEYFPRIRFFKALWEISIGDFAGGPSPEVGHDDLATDQQGQINMWLGWLRHAGKEVSKAPPGWLQVKLDWMHVQQPLWVGHRFMHPREEYQASWEKALEIVKREGRNGEYDEDLEDSGRIWLEEWAERRHRRRKGALSHGQK